MECTKETGLYCTTIEDMSYFTFLGTDINAYNINNPISLVEGDFDNFTEFSVIISDAFAKKNQIALGDSMVFEFSGTEYEFQVTGIGAAKGVFLRDEADGNIAIVPSEVLKKIYDAKTNLIFIKATKNTNLTVLEETLSKAYADYEVKGTRDSKLLDAEISNYTVPFEISSFIVLFMSIFIIYTAFSLITIQYIPFLGTARSVGATRKQMTFMLFVISILFGVVGGVVGCGLGIAVLHYIKDSYFQLENGGQIKTVYGGQRYYLRLHPQLLLP